MVLRARCHSNCLLLVASEQRTQRRFVEQVQALQKAVANCGRLLSHVGSGLLRTQGGGRAIILLLSVFILVDM